MTTICERKNNMSANTAIRVRVLRTYEDEILVYALTLEEAEDQIRNSGNVTEVLGSEYVEDFQPDSDDDM